MQLRSPVLPDAELLVHNPFSGELVGRVAKCDAADVAHAIRAATTYLRSPLSPRQRSEILARATALLQEETDRFTFLITQESGICLKETRKEVERAIGNMRVAAEEAVRLHGEALRLSLPADEKLALTLHEPVGIIAAITPFNRPLNQVVVKVAPAIAAGNAIIVKPSEKTPLTCLAFHEVMQRADLPDDAFHVLPGDAAAVANPLIDSPDIAMVSFTGGVATGRKVAQRATVKKIVLELGGNDPLFVLADADLTIASRIAADGATATAGQACRGIKRIFVDTTVADDFAELLTREVAAKRCGNPFDPATDIGCLIDEPAAIVAERRIASALSGGAVCRCGGKRIGALLQPTVLDHVAAESELTAVETFAPVAPILRFSDIDEAIEMSNATEYGLQAGVVTKRYDLFMKLATGLRVGAVNLMEGPQFDSPHIPFGGVKNSGIGREGIRYAMREMSTVKTIVLPWFR